MPKLISETRLMWGMPITVGIVDSVSDSLFPSRLDTEFKNFENVRSEDSTLASDPAMNLISQVFNYFEYIDNKFSTYKPNSEISRINQGLLSIEDASLDMQVVFDLAERLRIETDGYFNIMHDGRIDPSGLVKGWALSNAADLLCAAGCEDFYVEAGGDFEAVGLNNEGKPWSVGIRNPFHQDEIVKVLAVSNRGVATSGTYVRGQHIYNPIDGGLPDDEILSITVIGPNIYEADCYATAAFAMGRQGIQFIESLAGFEGYMIDRHQLATFTSGFTRYVNYETHR